ncbi:hypothetical protein GCM10017688_10500 [Streptomyces ramulosus]
MLSLRLDDELLERIRQHAAKRGMSVQDYVVRTLVREDFDERFQSSVDATERLGGWGDTAAEAEAADGSPAAHG